MGYIGTRTIGTPRQYQRPRTIQNQPISDHSEYDHAQAPYSATIAVTPATNFGMAPDVPAATARSASPPAPQISETPLSLYERFKNAVTAPKDYDYSLGTSSDEEDFQSDAEEQTTEEDKGEQEFFDVIRTAKEKEVDAGSALLSSAQANANSSFASTSRLCVNTVNCTISSATTKYTVINLDNVEEVCKDVDIDDAGYESDLNLPIVPETLREDIKELNIEETESVLQPHAPNFIASYRDNHLPDESTLGLKVHPSPEQIAKLKESMKQHYQLLLQQCVLSIRGGYEVNFGTPPKVRYSQVKKGKRKRDEFFGLGEDVHDFGDALDASVMMLEDLKGRKRDALVDIVQMKRSKPRKIGDDSTVPLKDGGGCEEPIESSNASSKENKDSNGGVAHLEIDGDSSSTMQANVENEKRVKVAKGIKHNMLDHEWEGKLGPLTRLQFAGISNKIEEAIAKTEELCKFQASSIVEDMDSEAGSIFCIKGLDKLDEAFDELDTNFYIEKNDTVSMLQNGRACELLLQLVGADYYTEFIPEFNTISHSLTYPKEISQQEVEDELIFTRIDEMKLRCSKAQFTAAEDNLVLRGVSLYGEKEWLMISDRFLPDRAFSDVLHRYAKLCVLVYLTNGVRIDSDGNLEVCPIVIKDGSAEYDEDIINANLKRVKEPRRFGLYRWTMEEDVMLLKAISLMGRMYADIGKRFIPHRARGALRKRYQVLQRRVKSVMKRNKKAAGSTSRKGLQGGEEGFPTFLQLSQHRPDILFGATDKSISGVPARQPTIKALGNQVVETTPTDYVATADTIPSSTMIVSASANPVAVCSSVNSMSVGFPVNTTTTTVANAMSGVTAQEGANEDRKMNTTETIVPRSANAAMNSIVFSQANVAKNIAGQRAIKDAEDESRNPVTQFDAKNVLTRPPVQPNASAAPITSISLGKITSNAVIDGSWCYFPRTAAVANIAAYNSMGGNQDTKNYFPGLSNSFIEGELAALSNNEKKSASTTSCHSVHPNTVEMNEISPYGRNDDRFQILNNALVASETAEFDAASVLNEISKSSSLNKGQAFVQL